MSRLLTKFQQETITRAECYELRRWLQAIAQGRVPAPTEVDWLLGMVLWALDAKIERLERGLPTERH